jgi:hypothetical protein
MALLLAMLALLPAGNVLNAQSELFDQKKLRQELEIMEGILQTTLQFGLKEFRLKDQAAKKEEQVFRRSYDFPGEIGRLSNITALYLYGQGAVFLIPVAGLQGHNDFYGVLAPGHKDIDLYLRSSIKPASPAPGSPRTSISPAPPAAGSGVEKSAKRVTEGNEEDLRKRLGEAQELIKKRTEDEAVLRAKLDELLGKIKGSLIEALANYGDSLTLVKPNEYITIVFTSETPGRFKLLLADEVGHPQEVISVQKSVITDYKAGKLPLESFRQKVLNYKN